MYPFWTFLGILLEFIFERRWKEFWIVVIFAAIVYGIVYFAN